MRTLVQISERLTELADDSDTEMVHAEADGLLVEAIRLLALRHCGFIEQREVANVIDAYDAVDKWYA